MGIKKIKVVGVVLVTGMEETKMNGRVIGMEVEELKVERVAVM